MGRRRFSANEIQEIMEAIETNEELPSDDWDVLNVQVRESNKSKNWIVVVRNNKTLKSYRLKWGTSGSDNGDLDYGDQNAVEVIPCMIYCRFNRVPFSMRFLEV